MKLTENWKNLEIAVSKLIAKAWVDDEFSKRLKSEPAEILREAGVVLEDFVKVIVNQDSTDAPVLQMTDGGAAIVQINLPSKPAELTDEQINGWGGGTPLLACSC